MSEGSMIETALLADLKIGNYQVWSRMSDERFDSFVEDVKENGIRDLIHVDEDYTILDGHHRYESAKIARITEVDVKVHYGLTEEEKLAIAYKNNTLTRELTRDEKIAKAIELREGGRSYRQIGDWLGVSYRTIHSWCSTVQDCTVEKVEGKDGKQRPSEKATSDEKQQRRERVKELRERGSKIAEIASEVGVSVGTVANDIKEIEKFEVEEEKKLEEMKRVQKLDLLEIEAKLTEETAPQIRENEPITSPDNIVIDARKAVQATALKMTGVFSSVEDTSLTVKRSYIKQVKSTLEAGLITLGQYCVDENDRELIIVCLELLKKYKTNEGAL